MRLLLAAGAGGRIVSDARSGRARCGVAVTRKWLRTSLRSHDARIGRRRRRFVVAIEASANLESPRSLWPSFDPARGQQNTPAHPVNAKDRGFHLPTF